MGLQWVVWGVLGLLGHYVHLLLAVEGLWSIKPEKDIGLLCDVHGFHYTVAAKLENVHSVQLRVFDQQGISTVISNSSVCKTSVVTQPCGSVVFQAAYDSCYTFDQVDHYIISILIEREYDLGKFLSPEMKELRCPKLPVTVQCTSNGQMSLAISKRLTEPPLRLYSIHVKDQKAAVCGPVRRTDELVVFLFSLSTCGTTSKESDGKVIYENVFVAKMHVGQKTANAKTLGHQLRIHIQCTLDPSDLPTESHSNAPLPQSLLDGSPYSPGLQMRIAKDNLYQEFYADGNYSVLKPHQNTKISIEVRILQNMDSNMTLFLHECWATPNKDPNHPRRWPVLMNGCPFSGENYESGHVYPVISSGLSDASHFKRFIVYANNSGSPSERSLHGMIYFHCNASMHVQSMHNHMPLCYKRRNRSTETTAANISDNRLTHGGVSNMTVLVSSHVPVYLPATLESTHVSGNGSPSLSGPLGQKWVRITIVVSVLVVIVTVFLVTKIKCKRQTEI